jgi:hypothetical protein
MGREVRREGCPVRAKAPPAKATDYPLTCSCGRQFKVRAAAVGTETFRECGARVRVPSLSELRAMAVRAAYETGTVDVIRRMLAEGSLPWGQLRAVSGKSTQDDMDLSVHCERVRAEKDGLGSLQVVGFLFGPLAMLLGLRSSRDPQGGKRAASGPRCAWRASISGPCREPARRCSAARSAPCQSRPPCSTSTLERESKSGAWRPTAIG